MLKTATAPEVNGAYGHEPRQFRVDENGGLITVKCVLTGISPLLCNAMSEDVLLSLYTKEKAAKTAAKPAPRELANSKVYRTRDGKPCIPPRNLYASLISAGQSVRLDGKRQISTATATLLPGMLTLASVELVIFSPGTKQPAECEVDIQQGKNPNGGEAVCIIRPRFDEWEIHAELDVDQKVMPLQMARELVDIAGRRIGLGDFRPQKRGTFGRFSVTRWGE